MMPQQEHKVPVALSPEYRINKEN